MRQQNPILNSWKEIASYFNRGVRTVQRWERELGLPAHRIGSGPRSPVFAYPHELERWMQQQALRNGNNRQPLDFPAVAITGMGSNHSGFKGISEPAVFQSECSAVEFLIADLNAGLKLAQLCSRSATDVKANLHTRTTARDTYDFVVRFSRRIRLTPAERLRLKCKMSQLRSALQHLGEYFES